jgi:hypothetical protein
MEALISAIRGRRKVEGHGNIKRTVRAKVSGEFPGKSGRKKRKILFWRSGFLRKRNSGILEAWF